MDRDGEDSGALHVARLLSVRALVLGVVVLAAFSMLFPTIRAYLGQRAELAALAAEVAAAEQEREHLEAELARWDDEAYVVAQARERLGFVRPGETPYRVIDPDVVVEVPVLATSSPGPVAGPALPVGGAVSPWYATIWESIAIAGATPVVPPVLPAPAGQVPDQPAPAAPVPTEPVPAEPVPAEPVPAEPVPAEPVPAEPLPAEPVPAESVPAGTDAGTGG